MASPIGQRAIDDALKHGNAVLKFISANNVGLTGSHECGFYLPKDAWQLFTPHPPERGENKKHDVRVEWQDGRITDSCITWYGKRTRSEYRLTRFGRGFPYLSADSVGNLLVLIPVDETNFLAYVLDLEEDIDEIQAALGVEVVKAWAVYEAGQPREETEDECVERMFREFAVSVTAFPTGAEFTAQTLQALVSCIRDFLRQPTDARLVRCVDAEYRLFKLVERRLCEPLVFGLFKSVDDFLKVAQSILNRRKSRAGRALENIVATLLREASLPFDIRPEIEGEPDIVLPGKAAYDDPSYPIDRLFVVGLKTTCKDRWRQVLQEGPRVQAKHLLTLQKGISSRQLAAMKAAGLTLIVPAALHGDYPAECRADLITVEQFIALARAKFS